MQGLTFGKRSKNRTEHHAVFIGLWLKRKRCLMYCIIKKIFCGCMLFSVGVILCLGMCSCGHNCIEYGDGIGFDAGINPENYTASFNLRYGKILSAVTRDNVEIEMTGKADADGAAGTEKSGSTAVTTDGTLKVKIGRQINGAAADLVKAGADPDKVVEALTKDEPEAK